jgi:hypothetical protein
MNPRKSIQKAQNFLRNIGLLNFVERLRYLLSVAKHNNNRSFTLKNPEFSLPPKALAYDAHSVPDWSFYKKSGEETAFFLAGISKKYLDDKISPNVLEWGCGPARVIRHIPSFFLSMGYFMALITTHSP